MNKITREQLTVEKALRIYTDGLITGKPIQALAFRNVLSVDDFKDFAEEIKMLDLLNEVRINHIK